jgi:hypothetical protein
VGHQGDRQRVEGRRGKKQEGRRRKEDQRTRSDLRDGRKEQLPEEGLLGITSAPNRRNPDQSVLDVLRSKESKLKLISVIFRLIITCKFLKNKLY